MRRLTPTLQGRTQKILKHLYKSYPDATCALNHHNPLELLVATILSAQCTDVRVNSVTSSLFKKYRTARDYANADPKELEQMIRPTGFFRNKAKSIIGSCRLLLEKHEGEVPDDLDSLLELPGVARKTANVVLGTWFGMATGVVVDTHVHRLSHRLGLSREANPNKVEKDLMELLPQERWIDFSHMMIWHGRKVCQARRPRCEECPLYNECPTGPRIRKLTR